MAVTLRQVAKLCRATRCTYVHALTKSGRLRKNCQVTESSSVTAVRIVRHAVSLAWDMASWQLELRVATGGECSTSGSPVSEQDGMYRTHGCKSNETLFGIWLIEMSLSGYPLELFRRADCFKHERAPCRHYLCSPDAGVLTKCKLLLHVCCV